MSFLNTNNHNNNYVNNSNWAKDSYIFNCNYVVIISITHEVQGPFKHTRLIVTQVHNM